jgi:hypothetical protein
MCEQRAIAPAEAPRAPQEVLPSPGQTWAAHVVRLVVSVHNILRPTIHPGVLQAMKTVQLMQRVPYANIEVQLEVRAGLAPNQLLLARCHRDTCSRSWNRPRVSHRRLSS